MGPIGSTEDIAAIANQQPIAGKTKVDTLANGDIKAADDESLVGASLDDAITSPVDKHDIQGGDNRILEIGTVVTKDPIMLEEVARDAELGSNTSEKEIQSFFEDSDSNKGVVEEQVGIGMEQPQDTHEVEQAEEPTVVTDKVGSIIVENSSEQARQKPSLLGEDKVENSGVEEATRLNEEDLPQEFSSREDRADEDVIKDNVSAGDLIMDKGDEPPTSTSIDQDEDSSEQVLEVQERPIVAEDGIQREPIAQELALPGQDEIVHEAPGLTTLDEKPIGGAVDDEESTKHLQGVHEAPLIAPEEVISASTEFPEQEVATHVNVENNSNEVSDSLPTQGDEIVEEAPTTALVTDVEDVSAIEARDCNVDESTKYTKGIDEGSKGVVDVTPTLENEVDEALPSAHVASNDNSSSLPMQDDEAPTAAFVDNVKDVSPTFGGEEKYVALKVEDCDVEPTKDVQGADETPTSPVEVGESTDVVDESNILETPPIVAKEEVIPASNHFEGEPELAKSVDVEVDSVESTEPLEEHAKNNSSQLSDSLPTEDEVSTAEDVSSAPLDEDPIGGLEEEFVALKADDSTKHTEGVNEEPVEVHESKDVADESNFVKDELTEVNTEDELVEVNTEGDVNSREAPLPLEEPPTDVVKNDSNEDVSPTPEPIVGEYAASKVEDCDVESTKDVQGADETPTSPVEESTDAVETPPTVAKDEVIPASSQTEGEPELVDVEVSTEDSVESTEAPVPLEEHADDVKNNSSQVSDSLPTQDEEVPTGSIVTTAGDLTYIEGVEGHESKGVADESTVVKDELTEVNTEDGLVEGNTEDDVKSREATLPLEEPVKNDSNEVLDTLPKMQDEIVDDDATIPLVEDVQVAEAEPVAGGEKESLAPNDLDESTKHTGVEGVDEAEEPNDVVDESTLVEAEVTPTLEDDVGSREATVPAPAQVANINEDSRSLPAHDEIVEEAPSAEDVSAPAQEEEPTVGREEKSVKVEDSEVEESAESTDVVDGLDAVEEKAILASNQFEGEPDVEFREASEEDPAQPTHDETIEEAPTTAPVSGVEPIAVEEGHIAGSEEKESSALSAEDCNVTRQVDEASPATTEIDDVVDESNVIEAPVAEEESKEVVEGSETPVHVVEEESKEVVDESETPVHVVEEESKEVVDESETPVHVVEEESNEVVEESETPVHVVDEESKEVVDESNSIETPSTVNEEEVSPASAQFEGESEVAEVAQGDVESKGEVKEVPTLPLVTSVEDVASSVALNSGDYDVDESTKHEQGVVEALPTQDSTRNEVLATPDEIVEEVPPTLITKEPEEESSAPKVEDSDADESRKHTEGVEETLPTSNESKDVVDDLETSSTVVEEATFTPVEVEPVDGVEEESGAQKVEENDVDESTKHTERVDETPTEVPCDEALAPAVPRTLEEKELIDHVGGGEEQVADGDNDVDQQVENAAQEVDEDSKNVVSDDSNLVDGPSTRVEDEVTPTSGKHEGEPLAPESGGEVEVIKPDVVESREIPMEGSVGNNSIEESSALSGQAEVGEEAPSNTSTPIAAIEADEAPSKLEETRDSDFEAPSSAFKDELTPSHEEPIAPQGAEDVMEDARESLEEEPTQVVQNSSSEKNLAGEHEAPKAGDDLPRELNVQLESVGDGVGSSSEFEAEPSTNGVPQHEDVGDLSEEETKPKDEVSMNGWGTNGGLVASTLRTIVTTTMNLVKTTKPSRKKRMKLKKVLEAKKMQQD